MPVPSLSPKQALITGLKDGLPIGLGYISVSFTFGMMAVTRGLPAWSAILISFTNLTSAGQFAGLDTIAAGGPFIEIALVQLVINLRYALMSLSWSQKLPPDFKCWQRFVIAFGDTDEIFAVSARRHDTGLPLTFYYMLGLMALPILCWTGGTVGGALASAVLPVAVRSALGLAIYGMFIAIVVPPAREDKAVRTVALAAVALSCALHFLPGLRRLSGGFAIILCGIAASALGAARFPVADTADEEATP